MKETGVIRKIDELGRIVIPKEIRRTLGIRDGENLEIFVEKDNICLQKHSLLKSIEEVAHKILEIAKDTLDVSLFIMDREKVVSSTISSFLNLPYNRKLTKVLEEREIYESFGRETLFDNHDYNGYFYIIPLLINGDVLGLIAITSHEGINTANKKILNFISKLIINKIDIL